MMGQTEARQLAQNLQDQGRPAIPLGSLSTDLRILTVRQPYADFITASKPMMQLFRSCNAELAGALPKNVENRTWGTNWRGTLLIHAGMSKDRAEMDRWGLDPAMFVTGAVVGVVDLVDVVNGSNSPWSLPGHQHWMLANPRRLDKAIRWTGTQGLRQVPPSLVADVSGKVRI